MLVNDKINAHKVPRPASPLGLDRPASATTLWQYIENIDPDNL